MKFSHNLIKRYEISQNSWYKNLWGALRGNVSGKGTYRIIFAVALYFFKCFVVISYIFGSYKIRSVHPSICPSVSLEFFLELYLRFFLNFSMVLETHMKLCVTEPDFLGKYFLPQKFRKWTKNGPKIIFFIEFRL